MCGSMRAHAPFDAPRACNRRRRGRGFPHHVPSAIKVGVYTRVGCVSVCRLLASLSSQVPQPTAFANHWVSQNSKSLFVEGEMCSMGWVAFRHSFEAVAVCRIAVFCSLHPFCHYVNGGWHTNTVCGVSLVM